MCLCSVCCRPHIPGARSIPRSLGGEGQAAAGVGLLCHVQPCNGLLSRSASVWLMSLTKHTCTQHAHAHTCTQTRARTHTHTHTHTHTAHTHNTHTHYTHTYVPTIHRWCSYSPSPPGMGYVAGVVVMHHVDEEVRSCDVTLYSNAPR